MSAQATVLAYEVPSPELRLAQVLTASQLAGWQGERAVLFIAELEALARRPEGADSIKGQVDSVELLYRNLCGEGLEVVRESELPEAQRAYKVLSGQVTVVSLLREQSQESKEAPLTLARLSSSLALAAALLVIRPDALITPRSQREEALRAAQLLAKVEPSLELELKDSGLSGRRALASEQLALPRTRDKLEATLQALPRDPLKTPGAAGRPELCAVSRLLDCLAGDKADQLRHGCREGAGCEGCLAALAEGLEQALSGKRLESEVA